VSINKPFWRSVFLASLAFGFSSQVSPSSSELFPNRDQRANGSLQPRQVYRYSVIPGGVYSTEELARVRRLDPVVASHYSDFGSEARVKTLNSDLFVYVSYRKANQVYWSATKHKVCQGESILSDGKNMARTRCGNRLSLTPKSPIATHFEPGEKALNGIDNDPLLAGFPNPPLFLPSMSGAGPDTPAPLPNAVSGANTGPSGASPAAARSGAGFPPAGFAPPQFVAFGGPGPALLSPAAVPPGVPITPGGPGTPSSPAPPGTPTVPVTPIGPPVPVTPGPPAGTPIPEPSELGLLLIAVLGVTKLRKRQNLTL
jgi:hypothetical protein